MTIQDERERKTGDAAGQPVHRIEEDHRTLRGQLEELEAATSHGALLETLARLPKMLREHFAHEEHNEGLYDDVRRRRPAMAPQLEALQRDHGTILEEFEALLARVKGHVESEPEGEGVADAVAHHLRQCIGRLRNHELEESTMIGDVYYTDDGGLG